MGRESLSLSSYPWPRYFRPVAGQEGKPMAEQKREVSSLLDVFYVQEANDKPTHLVAVVGCWGGTLDIKPENEWGQLPEQLTKKIDGLHATCRGKFRSIVGTSVDIFALEAMEQTLQAPGVNDAVSLYCAAQARIEVRGAAMMIDRLANRGRLNVGRLDLLKGCDTGFRTVFDSRSEQGEVVSLFVPTAPVSDVLQGRGVGLVYPTIDGQVGVAEGNEVIAKRVTYELLLAMQKDVAESDSGHWFAHRQIPVPNRQAVVWGLEADGYLIQGDFATRTERVQPAQTKSAFLRMWKQFGYNLNPKMVQIPAEAEPGDYQGLIEKLLTEFATSEDQELHDALATRLRLEARAIAAPAVVEPVTPKLVEKPVVKPAAKPTYVQPAPQLVQKITGRRVAKAGPQEVKGEWKGSFDPIVPQESTNTPQWWDEFAADKKKNTVATRASDWSEVIQPTKKPATGRTWDGEFK